MVPVMRIRDLQGFWPTRRMHVFDTLCRGGRVVSPVRSAQPSP